jgi:uncharacterized protein (TIGR02217 family)
MSDIGVLPALTGLGWSVTKIPTFQTRVQRSTSGRELRALDYPFPLWQFSLVYDFLRDTPTGSGDGELRILMGFYAACQGAFQTFLYNDPTDNIVTNQGIGIGDGHTAAFQLIRTLSDAAKGPTFSEPIQAPNFSGTFAVMINGVALSQLGNWSIDTAGVAHFTTAPAAGAVITASFSYYFRCRFIDDSYQFENFMQNLWSLKKLTFISVRI